MEESREIAFVRVAVIETTPFLANEKEKHCLQGPTVNDRGGASMKGIKPGGQP
jgi:hypothetical protein